jgi:hypothetical protein
VKLLEALNAMVDDPVVDDKRFLTDGAQDGLPASVKAVVEAANEELICGDGVPNLAVMLDLKKQSNGKFTVHAGETDSFGWLTGVIQTPKGNVVYG